MSLIGMSSRNHPQQARRRALMGAQESLLEAPVDATDAVDDRRTPPGIFEPLHAIHGFTVDAAASKANALLPKYWDRRNDGLAHDWTSHRVWCNPPYSALPTWVSKADRAYCDGCPLIVMLLPANRTEQGWWQTSVEPVRDRGLGVTTQFLAGRHRFGRPAGVPVPVGGDRPPFGLVIVTWEAQ